LLSFGFTASGEAAESDPAAKPVAAIRMIDAATKPGTAFVPQATTILADLGAIPVDTTLDSYGGMASRRLEATGFFRVERVGGRWWFVDPEGGLFLSRGLNSVVPGRTAASRSALQMAFGSEAGWADAATSLIRGAGFNTAGAWSAHDLLASARRPLAHARLWSFMASYGKRRGGTFQQAGHVGYPGDCPFIFDEAFPSFCEEHATQLAASRDDPLVLGHFSDNEMPWHREMLERYLRLPASDPGHRAARAWLDARGSSDATITDVERAAFLEYAIDHYLSIVGKAIRQADPNHLFLGVRLHGPVIDLPEVFRAAGRHCDVIAVNYYHAWTPDPDRMAMWSDESGRPFIVTEHYAKGVDSGMGNTGGAGWLVRTQKDRGHFYQNFVVGLLRSRTCIGWHWHRYADNDPADTAVDPSNRDSNKGIVTARYEPWTPLLDEMTAINARAYGLAETIDASAKKPKKPRAVVFPEDVHVERNVAYLAANRPQKADLYFPLERPGGRMPAVIIIHGGGFNDGDKDRRREINIGSHLARRGYVGMSIDYLLWSKGITIPTWPRNLHDAKQAVRWLRHNADRLGIDPDRIGVIGGSAGGNLAAMLALTDPDDGLEPPDDDATSTRVRCAVDLYGAVDLLNYHDMKMFLATRLEAPDAYRQASPISYASPGDAPVLIVHGTGDTVVDVSQSRTLAAILEAHGVEHEYVEIPDAPHTFDLDYAAFDVATVVFRFLDRHLKADAPTHP
jgi:acetyl esterase/lipase